MAENYYGQFIKIARAGGMQAICECEHFSECIKARPSNRDRLLKTDVEQFIAVMTHWRELLPAIGDFTDRRRDREELRAIKAPACLIAGNDVIHTPATARKAATLIPNSELHDDVVEKRADSDLLKEWDRKEWRDAEPRVAAIFAAFLKKPKASKPTSYRPGWNAMSLQIRRVVTGHTDDGRAGSRVDEIAKNVISSRPVFRPAWSGRPGLSGRQRRLQRSDLGLVQDHGRRRHGVPYVRYQPGVMPRNHRTDLIDYAVVISGEIDMELDDDVVVKLKAGDALVQRGTIHNWVNRGTEDCVIAFVLISAKPVTAEGKPLKAVVAR